MPMRTKLLLLTGAIVAILVTIIIMRPKSDVDMSPTSETLIEDVTPPVDDSSSSNNKPAAKSDSQRPVAVDNNIAITETFAGQEKMPEQGIASAPALKTYREEARQNPHGTPPSISAVAYEMAEHMPKARRDEKYATWFFERLSKCVEKGEVKTVREVCRENARELSEIFPDVLGNSYEDLKDLNK